MRTCDCGALMAEEFRDSWLMLVCPSCDAVRPLPEDRKMRLAAGLGLTRRLV